MREYDSLVGKERSRVLLLERHPAMRQALPGIPQKVQLEEMSSGRAHQQDVGPRAVLRLRHASEPTCGPGAAPMAEQPERRLAERLAAPRQRCSNVA